MKLRCFAITVFMLTAISAVSAQDICQFLGEWRTDSIEGGKQWGIEFYITDDGELLCSTRLFDTNRITTANVVIFDGTLYAEFHLKDSVNSNFRCDTIKSHILLECTIENDKLIVRNRYRDLVFSPWGNKYSIIFDKLFSLHKERVYTCKTNKKAKASAYVKDIGSDVYRFFMDVDSIVQRLNQNPFYIMSQFEYDNIRESYKHVIKLAEKNKSKLMDSDYNLIVGKTFYRLASIEPVDSLRTIYYYKAFRYLPPTDSLFDFLSYAYLFVNESSVFSGIPSDSTFSQFVNISKIINEYEGRENLDITGKLNYKWALMQQSKIFNFYFGDTEKSRLSLDIALKIDLDFKYLDSLFNYILCQYFTDIAFSIDSPDSSIPDSLSMVYYKKAMECRKKAKIEPKGKEESIRMYRPAWAYLRMNRKNDFRSSPEWVNSIFDSVADFLLDYSHIISYQEYHYALTSLYSLLRRHKDSEFLTLYDSIKNNFVFNPQIIPLYLWDLAYWGYQEDDIVKCAKQVLAVKSDDATFDTSCIEEFRCLSAYSRMMNGDFVGAYWDLYKYGRVSRVSIDSMKINRFIAMMSGEMRGYKDAFDTCQCIEGDPFVRYFAGYYAMKYAQNNYGIDTAKFMNRAREEYRRVVHEEDSLGIIDRTPFAYYWLGMKDSALNKMKQMLSGHDSIKACLYSAELYCLLGERAVAKECLNQYLQTENTPFSRAWVRHDSHLDAVRDYSDKLCEIYEGMDSIWPKHIIFKDTTISIPYYFGGWNEDNSTSGGSIYIRSKLCDIDTTMIFDPGAQYVQISPNIACSLISEGKLTPLENEKFKYANGGGSDQRMAILKSITLGGDTLRNVVVTVANDSTAPLLLGQNVLGVFSTVAIDYRNAQIHLTRTEEIIEENK